MKKVIQDDYVFNVDLEKSAAFYREQPVIFSGLSSYIPVLTTFLNEMGIDIEKPIMYRYHDTSDLAYKVFGSPETYGQYELYFHDGDRFAFVTFFKGNAENEFHLSIFDLSFQLPELLNYEESDGWLLYTLSGKFESLNSILSSGDHYNHAVFTYKELNRGLLRLIQNEIVEEKDGKYRLTKKGKVFLRKLKFPVGFLGSSTDNMLVVCRKIAQQRMNVEVDYSIDVISQYEYESAVKAHSQLFEDWRRTSK